MAIHLSSIIKSNLIWSTIFIYPSIQRSTDLFVSLPFLSCPVLSHPVLYVFSFMWHVYLSSDLSISFFSIYLSNLNRLIDPSVYPLRCTHGTRRCTTRGRPKWMHLPRPSGWEKSRRPMVWCIRRWQNARFKKCWKLGGSTVLPAFSILSDILSHSWYPMIIPCYPMVIF